MKALLYPLLIGCYYSALCAQTSPDIYEVIPRLDSLFFTAFNNCDLEEYESYLTYDYEFYHDKQGLTVTKNKEMESMLVFCGEQRQRQPIKRVLLPGSLEVFPLQDYGAVATGRHVFHLVINDTLSKPISQARFTSIWRLDNDEWKIARTLSYDHVPTGIKQLDQKTLSTYVGEYRVDPNRVISIRGRDNILVISEGEWSAELLPETENSFYLNQNNVQVVFTKNSDGLLQLSVFEDNRFVEAAQRVE